MNDLTSSATMRVYVIDDDETVGLSVEAALNHLGYEIRRFLGAEEFLESVDSSQPGCVVTDLQMPGIGGLELQRRLLEAQSPLMVVVVTGVADVPTVVHLMERGAVTLLEKPYRAGTLLAAVERGLRLSAERWTQMEHRMELTRRMSRLSQEERQVLEQMLTGVPNKVIAHQLNLSMRTVDRRRQAVLEKMEVQSPSELALLVARPENADPLEVLPAITSSQTPIVD